MLRAALYVRVSTDKQEGENQTRDLREYCQRQGWVVVKVYEDVISGKEDKRPAFDAMFLDAAKRQYDTLVFWDLSRFSRSGTLFTLQKLKQLENDGVSWHSYSEPYFSSVGQFRDVVLSVLATLAKMEREKISERTKAGLRRAVADGKTLGRPRRGREHSPVTLVEALPLYRAGLSERQIAEKLNTSRYRVTAALKKSLDFKGWENG
jgi:DNA invertase Pin-like site-specific DNA recombinase